jgi:Caspase domain
MGKVNPALRRKAITSSSQHDAAAQLLRRLLLAIFGLVAGFGLLDRLLAARGADRDHKTDKVVPEKRVQSEQRWFHSRTWRVCYTSLAILGSVCSVAGLWWTMSYAPGVEVVAAQALARETATRRSEKPTAADFDLYDKRSSQLLEAALTLRESDRLSSALEMLGEVKWFERDSPAHTRAKLLRLESELLFDLGRDAEAQTRLEEAGALGLPNIGMLERLRERVTFGHAETAETDPATEEQEEAPASSATRATEPANVDVTPDTGRPPQMAPPALGGAPHTTDVTVSKSAGSSTIGSTQEASLHVNWESARSDSMVLLMKRESYPTRAVKGPQLSVRVPRTDTLEFAVFDPVTDSEATIDANLIYTSAVDDEMDNLRPIGSGVKLWDAVRATYHNLALYFDRFEARDIGGEAPGDGTITSSRSLERARLPREWLLPAATSDPEDTIAADLVYTSATVYDEIGNQARSADRFGEVDIGGEAPGDGTTASSRSLGQTRPPRERLLAVGVDDYVSWDFAPLDYAVADANRVVKTFGAVGYDTDILINEQATRKRILGELEREARLSRPGDRTLFYFAGHGFSDAVGNLAVVTADGFALAIDELRAALAEHRGEALVIVDSCFSYRELPFDRYVINGLDYGGDEGLNDPLLLLAGAPGQPALESHTLRGGLFTHALLMALEGQTRETSGEVTVLDIVGLADEISRTTRALALSRYGAIQTPVINSHSAPADGSASATPAGGAAVVLR